MKLWAIILITIPSVTIFVFIIWITALYIHYPAENVWDVIKEEFGEYFRK